MRRQLRLPVSTTIPEVVSLGGGLDQVTPNLRLRPGVLRDALNFEQAISGGYARLLGYERTDGRPAPSDATYLALTCNITGTIAAGNTVTGGTSGATGRVISVTGSVVAVTKVAGTFAAAETLLVAAVVRATVTSLGGAGTARDWNAQQMALAADVYRADIAVPAGSGAVRGGFYYGATNYCFRDNAGGTALVLYKESAAGWVVVPFFNEVSFTAGGTEYAPGSTITQGANSATVKAVCLQSGAWGGTAVGRLIITTPTPGNFAAGAAAGGGSCTLSGAQTAITLLPGGHVQTDIGTLVSTRLVFGCDGVNRGWQFDGTTLTPITTGATADMPSNVLVHKDHLWFTFGNVLKNSGIANGTTGAPFNWTATAGGSETPVPDTITCLLRQPGSQSVGTMSVSTASETLMMYGTSAADFNLVAFEESAGARLYGGQRLGGQALLFGDLGVFSVAATQAFGNFAPAALTLNIRPFLQVRRTQCNASLVNREKSQYRVFFNDGYGLYMTVVNGRMMGAVPVYFPNKVVCAWKGPSPNGNEVAYFGSDNGMVYKLDAGTSHDGAVLDAYATLVFNASGDSRQEKYYKGATFEVQGEGYAEFSVTYQLNYGMTNRLQGSTPRSSVVDLGASLWDTGLLYDTAVYWDGNTLVPNEIPVEGTGVNVAIRIDSAGSAAWSSFTLNSIVLHWAKRRARKH